MCFFDQYIYQCGDFKWGPFRQHCAKEYRTGETCGMKLVMQNIPLRNKCRICDKLEVKYNRKAKEEDRIRRWNKESNKHRKASIEASEDIIEGLNRDIAKLYQERRDRLNILNYGTETYSREGLVSTVYRQKIDVGIPGIVDPPTRHRLKDSDNEVILEGSLLLPEASLPQERTPISKLYTENRLVKATCYEKVAPFDPTHHDQGRLYESQKDDIEVPRTILLRPHTTIKFGCQKPIIPDASMSKNNSFSRTKPSKTGPESSDDGENDLDIKNSNHTKRAETGTPHNCNRMSGYVRLAHSDNIDKPLAMNTAHIHQESAYQHSKYVHTFDDFALPTLQPGRTLEFQSPSTFQDKVLEMPRSFLISCAERPRLQDLKSPKSPRNGRTKVESDVALRESPHLMRTILSSVDHDSKSKQRGMINTIVLLVKQGVFDYLMSEFYMFFDQTWSINLKSCPESPDSSSGSDETSVNVIVDSNTSEDSMGGKKRIRGDPEEDKPGHGDKDDPKRPRLGLEMSPGRLACPYFKRDPRKFGVGTPYYIHGCAGQGWEDLAKLKEHLYRAHHSFFQCPRCKIRLRSQAGLNEHSEADEICESRTRDLEDGFDLETYLHLHNKRKSCKGQTDAERWKEIFSRLFPDHQPVPSPYVDFEAGDIEVSATSELEDLENFEEYRRREVPKKFANRATIEALRFSEPMARHLLGQVPNMIRDSEEAVSQQHQSALQAKNASLPDTFQHYMLPSHPDMPLSTQSRFPALNCGISNRTDNHNPSGSHQSSNLPRARQTLTSTDLHSSPLGPNFDSGQTKLCFCNGSCTCPSIHPGRFSTDTSSSEDVSLILHIVQNMSNRIATLEQQYGGHASRPGGLLSSSTFDQPSMQSDVSSSMRQDYLWESAADTDTAPRIQNGSSAFTGPSNELLASADASNDSLDWFTLLDIDNSEDQSSQ